MSSWTLTIYDSMARARTKLLHGVKKKLEAYLPDFLVSIGYWKQLKKTPKKKIMVTIGHAINVPQQPNGVDCGVFVCHFIERMLEQLPLQIDGDYTTWAINYRLRMANSLYNLRTEKNEFAVYD